MLDDIMNRSNSSIYFKNSIPYYDYFFTNKKYNIPELRGLGAKNVFYFKNGYSLQVHHPLNISSEDQQFYGCEVTFVGTFEYARSKLINYLAENNIRIKIWGWGITRKNSGLSDSANITLMDQYVYDEEYAKVISASQINLCFLRKVNRDTETTRSIEIPACKGFMIAERTIEHLELFQEGIEAEYFSSPKELLEKINYYLHNTNERIKIAEKGYLKCMSLKLSYHDQLKYIFSIIKDHHNE